MSMSRAKRILGWTLVVFVLGILSLYAVFAYQTTKEDPVSLVSCIKVEASWSAWTCKQALRYAALTPDQVRELNGQAGAIYPITVNDTQQADELLELFIARGVDINAVDVRANNRTALHVAMLGMPSEKVALLLKHGARPDARDALGMTPLDLARRNHNAYPDDPHLPSVIGLLEKAGAVSSQ